MAFTDNQDQVAPQAPTRTRTGQFAKGVSGNPLGRLGKGSARLREARRQEIFSAIVQDCGGKLTALEVAFATEAARMLATVATSEDPALGVRLTNGAARIIDRVKQSIAARCTGPKQTAFDEYVAKLNGAKR